MYKIINQKFSINFEYDIIFSNNIFNINNKILINIIEKSEKQKKKIIVFIDKNVLKTHTNLNSKIIKYFTHFNKYVILVCDPISITGGEKVKNHYSIVKIFYKLIEKYKICRQSYIISIGGGTIQDLMGYVSSTAHRGIKNIRIPTTVLSQDDSGVGVKNGINYLKKKNFIGCFSVPYAVLNDYSFLTSLSTEQIMEGLSEAIKVALIKDINLFYFIEKHVTEILSRNLFYIEKIIYKCAKLHADHISKNGDPFETLSSRPLDFGHWSAHKIESLSYYQISHGKSVAIGLSLDCTYSYLLGFMKKNTWKSIIKLFLNLNLNIYSKELSNPKIFNGLEEFREHLGGSLTISFIKDIGSKIEMHHVNKKIYIKAITLLYNIHNLYNK